MRPQIIALATAALVATAAAVFAQADPHEAREALMKANGGAMGVLSKIAKNEQPYDAAAVQTALGTLAANGKKMSDEQAALFPEGSGEGNEAAPAIWTNPEGFKAEVDKFRAATETAAASVPADAAAVGAAIGAIGQSCGSCHEGFRLKKG